MNDTDFEALLAECLHRHADPIAGGPGMIGHVDRRSRELRRRRHTMAALAITPVTAGVAVGAVALSGSHSTSQHPTHRASLRTLASATPTPTKTPIDVSKLTEVCTAGTVPHLAVTDQKAPYDVINPQDIVKGEPEIYKLITAKHLDGDSVVLTKDGRHVDGAAILVAGDLKNGSTKRVWLAGVFQSGRPETVDQALSGPVEVATFVGCVVPTAG